MRRWRGWAEAQRLRGKQEFSERSGSGDQRLVGGEELAQMLALKGMHAAPETVFQTVLVARRRAAFSGAADLNVKIRLREGCLGELNAGILFRPLRRRELNVEILIGEAHQREKRIGALDHGAGDSGRGAAGGAERQARRAERQTVNLFAVDEKAMQKVGLRLAGGGVKAGEGTGKRGLHV